MLRRPPLPLPELTDPPYRTLPLQLLDLPDASRTDPSGLAGTLLVAVNTADARRLRVYDLLASTVAAQDLMSPSRSPSRRCLSCSWMSGANRFCAFLDSSSTMPSRFSRSSGDSSAVRCRFLRSRMTLASGESKSSGWPAPPERVRSSSICLSDLFSLMMISFCRCEARARSSTVRACRKLRRRKRSVWRTRKMRTMETHARHMMSTNLLAMKNSERVFGYRIDTSRMNLRLMVKAVKM